MRTLDLSLDWCEPWKHLITGGEIECRYEMWRAGDEGRRVFCFDSHGNRLQPYERSGLSFAAIPLDSKDTPNVDAVTGGIVRHEGRTVAWFDGGLDGVCLRLYLHMPEDAETPLPLIPHHVADAYVCPGVRVELFSHADVGWVKRGPFTYLTAVLGQEGVELESAGYNALIRAWKQDMALTHMRHNFPDMLWLYSHRANMPKAVEDFVVMPAHQAVGSAPLVGMDEAYEYGLEGNAAEHFQRFAGSSSASVWRLNRGMGAAAATPAFIEERLREAIGLRGPRDHAAWLAHKDLPREQPADPVDEFCCIVEAFILNPTPQAGVHREERELHAWAREAIENVVYALGAYTVTRRYVFDHRWEPRPGKVEGSFHECLQYNVNTDENTLGCTIPGDCEDSNSTIYYFALLLLLLSPATGTLLWYAKACLVAAGVPCCVFGSAQAPSEQDGHDADQPHLYGYIIPHRTFAPLVWGGTAEAYEESCLRDMNRVMGTQGCFTHAYWAAIPMVLESILFTTPDHLDPERWTLTGHRELFSAYHDHMRKVGENLVFPRNLASNWPLAIVREGTHGGLIIHGLMLGVFTAAIPILFAERHSGSLMIDPIVFTRKPDDADPDLLRTTRFIPIRGPDIGVVSTALYSDNPDFRLVTASRWTAADVVADERVTRFDRYFVPLRPLRQSWVEPFRTALIQKRLPLQETLGPLPSSAKDRFTLFVYADRLQEGATVLAGILEDVALFKERCRAYSLRPYCWAVAVVLHMNVEGMDP